MKTKTHIQWFLEIMLNKNLSLRYYFIFEDHPSYNKKWVLKEKENKNIGLIDENAVKLLLKTFNKSIEEAEEVICRTIDEKTYRRVRLDNVKMPEEVNILIESDKDKKNVSIFCLCEKEF